MAVLAVMWALVLFLLMAIAVDGGLAISQHERAADLADEAARAEAAHLNTQDLRGTGTAQIIDDHCALAAAYVIHAAPDVHFGTASVDQGYDEGGCHYFQQLVRGPGGVGQVEVWSVTVEVELTYSPFVFDMFGGTISIYEQGTAFAQAGD
jgi:hypothetical protein